MIAFVLMTASIAAATRADSTAGILGLGLVPPLDYTLRSLGSTLKLVSAESIHTARAAATPVLQVANDTALGARSTLQDLGGDVALAVVRARASGWDAAHCAQEKEKQAEQVIQEAMSKLDGCTALAAMETEVPVEVIQNLTQEASQRVDLAAGHVAACMAGTNTIACLFDVVRNVTEDVSAVTRIITKQALGAEQSVAHVTRYVTSCATGQVQSARKLLQELNISGCTQ